jgi:hypothetical protein
MVILLRKGQFISFAPFELGYGTLGFSVSKLETGSFLV